MPNINLAPARASGRGIGGLRGRLVCGLEKSCVACQYGVRPVPHCVCLAVVVHGFESCLGFRRQCVCECNSTRADIALFYFMMAISVYPDMQFAMALALIMASQSGLGVLVSSSRGEI